VVKPPLPIAPLTDEDVAIWRRITRDRAGADPVFCSSLVNPDSDRFDALLMLEAATFHPMARNFPRLLHTPSGLIDCGGRIQL
jgi:hypothetical protein